MEKINWYPGHMKKTRELIQENMKVVDLAIELVDARIPVSSRNPVLGELISGKPEIIVLNKEDLADPGETLKWVDKLSSGDISAISLNSNSGEGASRLMKKLDRMKESFLKGKKWDRPLRMMIVGVPNVGKSSLINRLTKRKAAKTGDRPGVTKGKQWLTLDNGMQLLDTPGILMPNIEDPESGKKLAYCGAIKDEIYDISDLCLEFIGDMLSGRAELLIDRYGLTCVAEDGSLKGDYEPREAEEAFYTGNTGLAVMEEIAVRRGFLLPGKRIDYERCARTVLDEFRAGKLGRVTLEPAE